MLLLFSVVPVRRHLVIGIVDFLVRNDGRSHVLQQVALQEWPLIDDDMVGVVRVNHCVCVCVWSFSLPLLLFFSQTHSETNFVGKHWPK